MNLVDSISYNTTPYKKGLVTIMSADQARSFGIESDSLGSGFYVLPKKMEVKTFITQNHKKSSFEIHKRPQLENNNASFYSLIVLLMFIGILLGKILYPRRFQQFLKAAFSNKALFQLLREWQPLRNILSYLYSFVYLAGFTTLIMVVLSYLGSELVITSNSVLDFLIIYGAVIFIVAGKYQTIIWLSVIFNVRGSGMRYLSNQITYALLSILVLLPILLVLIFNPSVSAIIIGLSLIGLMQVMRIVRSISVGLAERDIHLLYLFLYLCTLEIVPILILIKFLAVLSTGGSIG